MNDEILGKLQPAGESDTTLQTTLTLAASEISLRIEGHGAPLDSAIALARRVVAEGRAFDGAARAAAEAKLRSAYNENWRHYTEAGDDGKPHDVDEPELDEQEFMSRMRLVTVTISGSSRCEFIYDDDGMFWGHSIHVRFPEAPSRADAHVDLAG